MAEAVRLPDSGTHSQDVSIGGCMTEATAGAAGAFLEGASDGLRCAPPAVTTGGSKATAEVPKAGVDSIIDPSREGVDAAKAVHASCRGAICSWQALAAWPTLGAWGGASQGDAGATTCLTERSGGE
eukprot:gnl/TRDRNA2_/TRDRNA2_172386_c0_seq3.p2 gnl/TRDRNA2_/TRDRNA2_172386_c0~~gnl/TRDRNA2_/TRDRNA2_172386_c0_seq3.p2  ORF type:complete len:127 (-),score=27.52 gnl/TRDRNA2_/TRDRNA2_172386_c0_seq3:127-507(-)